jgi:hypothetical protein
MHTAFETAFLLKPSVEMLGYKMSRAFGSALHDFVIQAGSLYRTFGSVEAKTDCFRSFGSKNVESCAIAGVQF